jgi:hypothetical protein
MATTIAPVNSPANPDITGREVLVYFNITLTGNYVANGDTLNLQQLQDLAKSSQLPLYVDIWEAPPAGTAPSGYSYLFAPGTTQLNGVLLVLQGGAAVSSPQGQFPAGAYNAGLTGAVIKGMACFPAY